MVRRLPSARSSSSQRGTRTTLNVGSSSARPTSTWGCGTHPTRQVRQALRRGLSSTRRSPRVPAPHRRRLRSSGQRGGTTPAGAHPRDRPERPQGGRDVYRAGAGVGRQRRAAPGAAMLDTASAIALLTGKHAIDATPELSKVTLTIALALARGARHPLGPRAQAYSGQCTATGTGAPARCTTPDR